MDENNTEVITPDEIEKTDYPDIRLWNPKSFIWISVFFSFLPAAIIYSLNYGRLGQRKKRNICLLSAFLLFAAAIFIASYTNVNMIRVLFYGLNIGLGIFLRNDQMEVYKEHLANGGKKASLLIPTVACIGVSALIIWGLIFTANIPDTMIVIQGDELYYTDKISQEEVERLGSYLEANEILIQDGNSISVKIDRVSDTYIFSIVIDKAYVNDEVLTDFAESLCLYLSEDVFDNNKVEVNFTDNRFNTLKKVTIFE